ncbi:MAG: T9SS type A sorting domain-containing protein [Candidatus Latescibacterota bacterium]|nr:MAG: T9SS type A sorting domain-containing protein [Candidatus Latescibacterota bacterium]
MHKGSAAKWVSRPTVVLSTIAVVFVLLPSAVFAQELYGCDNTGQLFTIDVTTGAGTHVCDLPIHPDPGATEIEYDDWTFRAFVQARDGIFAGQLVDVYTCTPLDTLVGTDDFAFNGLEFVAGVLYGTGIPYSCEPSHLMVLDPETGATIVIGPTGKGPISGLAWDETAGIMYGITGCWQVYRPAELVTIDLATGLATTIGVTGISAGSLEFGPDGMLYAGGNNQDGGNLYQIDPSDGTATLIGPTGFPGVSGLTLVTAQAIEASLDIKPGSCPNPLNVKPLRDPPENGVLKKGGVIPVAVLGTDEFDVHEIDPATVRLEGVQPLRYDFEDVATPAADSVDCDCTTEEEDGYEDLTLKFTKRDIVRAIAPGVIGPGVELKLTGELIDGTPFEAVDCVNVIGEEIDLPIPMETDGDDLKLRPATPNPFNPMTRISYVLPEPGIVRVSIYDVAGRHVTDLVSGAQSEGEHTVVWNAGGMASGIYFYRLQMGDQSLTRKMILLK